MSANVRFNYVILLLAIFAIPVLTISHLIPPVLFFSPVGLRSEMIEGFLKFKENGNVNQASAFMVGVFLVLRFIKHTTNSALSCDVHGTCQQHTAVSISIRADGSTSPFVGCNRQSVRCRQDRT